MQSLLYPPLSLRLPTRCCMVAPWQANEGFDTGRHPSGLMSSDRNLSYFLRTIYPRGKTPGAGARADANLEGEQSPKYQAHNYLYNANLLLLFAARVVLVRVLSFASMMADHRLSLHRHSSALGVTEVAARQPSSLF